MSFSGIGLPAIFGDMSKPLSSPTMPHSPWWHTPGDLLDKVDDDILLRDARACLHGLWSLLTDPILPLDYARYAQALVAELTALDGVVPLTASIEEALKLAARAESVLRSDGRSSAINQALMSASRALVPIAYTRGDRFTHDPALPQATFPVLDPIRRLAAEEADTGTAKFAAVAARRARNRVHHALRQANKALAAVLLT